MWESIIAKVKSIIALSCVNMGDNRIGSQEIGIESMHRVIVPPLLIGHFVPYACYGSNQSLCVASHGLRHNLDQNKPMCACVRSHSNFEQLWRNGKRSHNPHLYSKYMISLAGNSRPLEKLLTL